MFCIARDKRMQNLIQSTRRPRILMKTSVLRLSKYPDQSISIHSKKKKVLLSYMFEAQDSLFLPGLTSLCLPYLCLIYKIYGWTRIWTMDPCIIYGAITTKLSDIHVLPSQKTTTLYIYIYKQNIKFEANKILYWIPFSLHA